MSIAGTDSTKALFKSSITTKDMSEDDKISQMMSDSGDFYNQKNWLQLRGRSAYAGQKVPQNYKCNRCNQSGHFIYDCPQGKNSSLPSELKGTTGIPRSFLQPATAESPGQMQKLIHKVCVYFLLFYKILECSFNKSASTFCSLRFSTN
jgi:hypothetical protein